MGAFQFAARDQIVQRHAEAVAFAVAEPADARGQALETHAFLRELDPARKNFVVRKHFEHQLVGAMNVGRLTGKRRPAERAAAFAEKRTNVGGHEAGKIVGVLHALLKCEGADVVAVIKSDRAHFLQREHAFHVARDGIERALFVGGGIGLCAARRLARRRDPAECSRRWDRARWFDR